jgi:hypothetical protein
VNHATKAGQNFGFPYYGGGHVRTEEYKNETPPADEALTGGQTSSDHKSNSDRPSSRSIECDPNTAQTPDDENDVPQRCRAITALTAAMIASA